MMNGIIDCIVVGCANLSRFSIPSAAITWIYKCMITIIIASSSYRIYITAYVTDINLCYDRLIPCVLNKHVFIPCILNKYVFIPCSRIFLPYLTRNCIMMNRVCYRDPGMRMSRCSWSCGFWCLRSWSGRFRRFCWLSCFRFFCFSFRGRGFLL